MEKREENSPNNKDNANEEMLQASDDEMDNPEYALLATEQTNLFSVSDDKKKLTFPEVGLEPNKIESYTIIFGVEIHNNLRKLTEEIAILSIGRSSIQRSIIIGIAPDKMLFVHFKSSKGRIETLSSQSTFKMNTLYQVAFVYNIDVSSYDVSLYINGVCETESSLAVPLENLQGIIQLGSDSPTFPFKGVIHEPMFISKALLHSEIKEMNKQMASLKGDSLFMLLQEKKKFQKTTEDFAKKSGTPLLLVQNYKFKDENSSLGKGSMKSLHQDSTEKQLTEDDSKLTWKEKIIISAMDNLREYVESSERLFDLARAISCNFLWLFKSCMILSPEIDGCGSKTEHNCLHKDMSNQSFQDFPVYIIELARFEKLLNQIQVNLTFEELEQLIKRAEKIEKIPKHPKFGYYFQYDILLYGLRFITMTPEENDEIDCRVRDENGETLDDIPEPPELHEPDPVADQIRAEDMSAHVEKYMRLEFGSDSCVPDENRLSLGTILAQHSSVSGDPQNLGKEIEKKMKLRKLKFFFDLDEIIKKHTFRGMEVKYKVAAPPPAQNGQSSNEIEPPKKPPEKQPLPPGKKPDPKKDDPTKIKRFKEYADGPKPENPKMKPPTKKEYFLKKKHIKGLRTLLFYFEKINDEKDPYGKLEGIKAQYEKKKDEEKKMKEKAFGFFAEDKSKQIVVPLHLGEKLKIITIDLVMHHNLGYKIVTYLKKTKKTVEQELAGLKEIERAKRQEVEDLKTLEIKKKKEKVIQDYRDSVKRLEERRRNIVVLLKAGYDISAAKFQIHVTHCFNCRDHQNTTRHDENLYITAFNELGDDLKSFFPGAELIGNYEKPKAYGQFDVYLVGVNPKCDEFGRSFLYKNIDHGGKFPKLFQFYDELLLTVLSYGDPSEITTVQENFLKMSTTRPPKSDVCHEHPCSAAEKPQKVVNLGPQNGDKMICQHWPCFQEYIFQEYNAPIDCKYHPGKYEFGSIHALWPESWSCCRKPWEAEGCQKGPHKGVLLSAKVTYCINHGDPNPGTEMPDSFCGATLKPGEDLDGCTYHKGYIQGNIWTCCEEGKTAPGCCNENHRIAKWPEEEAKIYFVRKNNMSMPVGKESDLSISFRELGRTSCFFRKTLPYKEVVNHQRQLMEKRKIHENDPRICTNWGCGKEFIDKENFLKPKCQSHTGVWDFGHTGISTKVAMSDYFITVDSTGKRSSVLWKPHWTCCRNEKWEATGCKKQYHSGPLKSEVKPKKYEWPDTRAQEAFKKVVRPEWKRIVQDNFSYDEETLKEKLGKFLKSNGKSVSVLPELCDRLNLHLLVITEDLVNHFKFLDIVNRKAETYLTDSSGSIDEEKFVQWWFADMNTFREMQLGNFPQKTKQT